MIVNNEIVSIVKIQKVENGTDILKNIFCVMPAINIKKEIMGRIERINYGLKLKRLIFIDDCVYLYPPRFPSLKSILTISSPYLDERLV